MSLEQVTINANDSGTPPIDTLQQELVEAVHQQNFNAVNSLFLIHQTLTADVIFNDEPLIFIAVKATKMRVVELLFNRCNNFKSTDKQNKNVLHHLFKNPNFYSENNTDLLTLALDKGADLFHADDNDTIPLTSILHSRCDQHPDLRRAVVPYITPMLLDNAREQHEPLLIHLVLNVSDFSEKAYIWLIDQGINPDAYSLEFESITDILGREQDQAFAQMILQLFEHQKQHPKYLDEYEWIDDSTETTLNKSKITQSATSLNPYATSQIYLAPTKYTPYEDDPEKEQKMREDADPKQWDKIFTHRPSIDDTPSFSRPLSRRYSRSTGDLRLSGKKEHSISTPVLTRKPKLKAKDKPRVSKEVLMVRARFTELIKKLRPHPLEEDELGLLINRAPIAQSYVPGANLDTKQVQYIPVRYKPNSRNTKVTNKPKEEDRQHRQEFLLKTSVYRRASILKHQIRRASVLSLSPPSPDTPLSESSVDRRSSIFSYSGDSVDPVNPLIMQPLLTRTLSLVDIQAEAVSPLGKTLDKIHQLEDHFNVLVPVFRHTSYKRLHEPSKDASSTLEMIRTAAQDLKGREYVSGQYSDIVNNLSIRFEQYDFELCAGEQAAIAFHSLELVGEILAFREAWRDMIKHDDVADFLRASTNSLAAVAGITSIVTEVAAHFTNEHDFHILDIVSKCATSFSNIQTALSQLFEILKRLKESNLIEDIEHRKFDSESVPSYLSKGVAFAKTMTFSAKALASAANKILEITKQASSLSTAIPIVGIVVSVMDITTRILATGQHIRCCCEMAEIKACLKMDFPDSEALSQVIDERGRTNSVQLKWLAFKANPEHDDVMPSDVFNAKRYYQVRGLKRINQKRVTREVIAIAVNVLQISSDILKLTGVASEVGLGLSATTATLKTVQLTTRAGKQQVHNLLKDDKSQQSKHEARCYQIQVFIELIEAVAIGCDKKLTEDELYRAQLNELKLLFKAAGMRLDKFLDPNRELKDRIHDLYKAIKQREGLSF
ncbi:ankyrin repeat domain-containing protein [Parashewanella curva]|uniref:Ankyrin repeat domain-containing protein n=1 Tax=Parashewanella curva TaxID=2338552 RepID=A0A3L8PS83_9GAMM|nr:ankyrin repeat domain-containing protein [Parashewanella curva]RLV58277.1 ankyrin repeat domain-containing protein [Parashewanella curva]